MRLVVEWFPSGDTPCRPRMNDAEDCGNSSKLLSLEKCTKSSFMFYRSDNKDRRTQKKQKDSYLNAFSNKIKQNIDKYRTELSTENANDSEDIPVASSVSKSN